MIAIYAFAGFLALALAIILDRRIVRWRERERLWSEISRLQQHRHLVVSERDEYLHRDRECE